MMWKAVCCAVQGRSHIKSGIACQDKVYQKSTDRISVIALADGAGSAKLSHYGAECVVKCVSALVVEHFEEFIQCQDGQQVREVILNHILQTLHNQAWILKCTLEDLASTLLVAAVSDEDCLLIHVGDGVIGYLDNSELKVASIPENGEFSNSTVFVTSKDALASMRLFKSKLKNISGFVLMSDGSEQTLYHKRDRKLSPVLINLMRRTCLLEQQQMERQLQESVSTVLRSYTLDDCSLAILARPIGTLQPVEQMQYEDRRTLYRIKNTDVHQRKRVSRYDTILAACNEAKTLQQISHQIHLAPKHTIKYLNHLVWIGVLSRSGMRYSRV